MAAIIPNLSTIKRMTPGERRFGRRLEAFLEDDYTVWYDIPIGKQEVRPVKAPNLAECSVYV